MKKTVMWAIAGVLLICMMSGTALAEVGLETKAKDKKGFRLGIVHIHPALAVSTMYDTNVQNTNDNTVSDLSLDVNGGVKLNIPHDIASFTLAGGIGYLKYFGIDNSRTTDLDSLEGNGRLALQFLRKSIVTFGLSDTVVRTTLPEGVTIFDLQKRINNTARANVGIQPNGAAGNLKVNLGYAFDLQRYDDAAYQNNNFMAHEVTAQVSWAFLPKTAVFLAGSYRYTDFYDFTAGQSPLYQQSPNASPIEVKLGLIGRLSPMVSINLYVGYANNLAENLENYHSANAKAEGVFQFLRRTRMKLGFVRSSRPVTVYGYMAGNKAYLEFQQWAFNDRFRFTVNGSYEYQQFGELDPVIFTSAQAGQITGLQGQDRSDHVIRAETSVGFYVTEWFSIAVAYKFMMRDSSIDTFQVTVNNVAIDQNYDFMKHQAMLNLRLSY